MVAESVGLVPDPNQAMQVLWLVPLLPLVGAVINLFVGKRLGKAAGWLAVVMMALSFAVAVLAVVALFGRELFVLCQDEEVAKASGLPVRFLSLLIAVTAALTVVIAMRVVGLLLVSALMVVPVATSQQLTKGFRATMLLSMAIGVAATVEVALTTVTSTVDSDSV